LTAINSLHADISWEDHYVPKVRQVLINEDEKIPTDKDGNKKGVQIQENITSQTIPHKGIWRFDVYFDNKYFDSIVIEFK